MHVHSHFSIKYGIMSPEELILWADESSYPFILLADINSTGAALDFLRKAQAKNVQPIIGVELRNDLKKIAIIIARNNRGFHEINTYLSEHLHQQCPFSN
jgi:DNA polymerase-3 subunit alpha